MIGEQVKRYKVLEEVGRGGMAIVYRAVDTALDREVAIKVLHPHLASKPASSQRFLREAQAVAKLHHRNIVEIYDIAADESEPQKFLVTEFIDGATLDTFIVEHPPQFPEFGVAIAACLCDALEHAHETGIIHRDVKPENIMLYRDGRLKLTDFGIARVLEADRMTASGSLLGSPAHMPPETIDGAMGDVRGDVFSLGTVLYYVTTGQLPFVGNSPTHVLRNIIEARFKEPDANNPLIGRSLNRVIHRCLETDPDARYQSMAELREALLAELSWLEIDDHVAFAKRYLAQPDKVAEGFGVFWLEHALQRAESSLEKRSLATTADLLNRALAYDPDSQRAKSLLKRMQRGRLVRLVAILVVVSVLLLGAGVFFANYSPEQPPPEPPQVEDAPPAIDLGPANTLGHTSGAKISKHTWRQVDEMGNELGRQLRLTRNLRNQVKASLGASRHSLIAGSLFGARYKKTIKLANLGDKIQRKPAENTSDPHTDTQNNTQPEEIPPPAVSMATYKLGPLFPDEGYAQLPSGKKIPVDPSDASVSVDLPLGKHLVTLHLKDREAKRLTINVYEEELNTIVEEKVYGLKWKHALLRFDYPKGVVPIAVWERADNGKTERFNAPGRPTRCSIDGFSDVGQSLKVSVYFVREDYELSDTAYFGDLSKSAEKSMVVELLPGGEATVSYN